MGRCSTQWLLVLGTLVSLAVGLGCGAAGLEPAPRLDRAPVGPPATAAAASSSPPGGRAVAWQPATRSPQPFGAPPPRDAPLYARCGEPDEALARVAAELGERRLGGGAPPRPAELAALLRVQGAPHVWPAAWSTAGSDDERAIVDRLARWVERAPAAARPRCGVSRLTGNDGRPVVSAVRVDALADLDPLPTRARLGQWLSLDATLNVAAAGVQVVLLGPRGRPHRVPSSLAEGRARARFALDQPGGWLVQLVASLPAGPLPVLEARVFIDVPLPLSLGEDAVPGQAEVEGEDPSALLRMVNAARASERLPPLQRDPELDRLADEHASRMAAEGELGHEVGAGTPTERVIAAGLGRGTVGENVAAAATLAGAHGALWASPSHRENLLGEQFHRVGLAVVIDAQGRRWVAEIFTD